jgi:hypothetical protein
MTPKLVTVALFTCAAFLVGETEPPQRVNIEVTGSPQCLANVAGRLDLPAVTMPIWSGSLGRMESLDPSRLRGSPRWLACFEPRSAFKQSDSSPVLRGCPISRDHPAAVAKRFGVTE